MKILMVHNHYQQLGGEDIVFQQECEILTKAGHEVTTYVRTNDEIRQYSGVKKLLLVPQTIWATDSQRQFAALLEKAKPRIVHVHNTFIMISPSIFAACQKAKIPVVQSLHNYRLFCPAGTFYRDGHVCEDCAEKSLWSGIRHGCYRDSRGATAVVSSMIVAHRRLHTWTQPSHFYIALSQFARDKFVALGLPSEKIFIKPNFVDPDPGMPSEKGHYAVFAGRLSPEKRVSTVLKAWEMSKARFPLLILGGGPEKRELEKLARERGLSGIRFEGHVPREQVIATIRNARFLVFSSEWYENFPVTIVEAFAAGTPVICSRLGAMQEIVSDGRTGLHFTPGDHIDLAAKMDWAWNNAESLKALGRAARVDYETKYTSRINYHLLINIYEQVIERSQIERYSTDRTLQSE